MSLSSNIELIRLNIAEAEKKAGLLPKSINLVAMSKTVPLEILKSAISLGLCVFGESYVQEAEAKIPLLKELFPSSNLLFHMCGHLQTNKVKKAVVLFDVIETVDKIELAKEIEKEASKCKKMLSVLVQVNISGEKSKSGVNADECLWLCKQITRFEHLTLSGLMCIGSLGAKEKRIAEFAKMKVLFDNIEQDLGYTLPFLSMGMSDDYQEAILNGANVVRIGTSLFGERVYE